MPGHFRKSFLGFNPKQVDQDIEKMKSENVAKQSHLSGEIKSLTEENAGLLSRLPELRESELVLNKNLPALNMAKKHADFEANSLIEKTRLEAEALIVAEKERIRTQNSVELEKINREIEDIKGELQYLLDFIKISINSSNLNDTFEQIVAASDKIAGAIIPGNRKNRPYLSRMEEESGEIVRYEIKDSTDRNIADGSVIPAAAVVALRKEGLHVQGDLLFEPISEREEIGEPEELSYNRQDAGSMQESGIPDLDLEKTRYITGKISGRDILDDNGVKIVARGEIITAEIVDMAEKAGKLPELIVHMIAPGLDLDEAL